jgi:hypothetical protein
MKREYHDKQQGEMVDDQRANQTARSVKEGKQTTTKKNCIKRKTR